jgi:NhaA family Na+:H+ antiporter
VTSRADGDQPSTSALREFLHEEAAAGAALVIASVVALIWANSPFADSYHDVWHHALTLGRGAWAVTEDLQHWINDGLMAIFFFVVGLEIKRELVTGELRGVRAATLPAIAAVGGAILPAAIFLAVAPAGEASRGWGVPMATDIAFAVGVLALAGARADAGTKLLLLSIAIVDDIIAIAVIAIFYSTGISLGWLAIAVLVLAGIALMGRWVTSPWAYVIPALVAWYALLESGVHATIAGVALGLLTPAHPIRGRPVLEQLEHALHPVSAFFVVPLFALANAGVYLREGALAAAFSSALTWAIVAGLIVGKTFGITGATFGARRLGIGVLPAGMPAVRVWPVAGLGGIGFTVALFIADLAFNDPAMINDAKVGILGASVAAALIGSALLRLPSR